MSEFEIIISVILGLLLVVMIIVFAFALNDYVKSNFESYGKERQREKTEEAQKAEEG